MITYSIIQKSQLEGALRLDAEYYQPEYLELDNVFKKIGFVNLKEISRIITDGDHGNPEYANYGIPYIKSENINELLLDFEAAQKISLEYANKIRENCFTKKDDILLTTVGRIGTSTVIHLSGQIALSRDVARVHLKNNVDFLPEFIAVFLNSNSGLLLTERESVGTVQRGLYLNIIKKLKIPKIDINYQKEIKNLFLKAREAAINSKSLYSQAENLLLEELGLKDFKVEDDLLYIVNLSQIKSAHRADAEYFQPKYEKLISKIKNRKTERLDLIPLNKLFSIRRGDFIDPSYYVQKSKRAYIRIKELPTKGDINLDAITYIDDNFSGQNLETLLEGDFVFAGIGATLGKTARIPKELEGSFYSNNTARFRMKREWRNKVNTYYLQVVLQSIICQLQFEQKQAQTAQAKIADEELKTVLVPILPKSTQQKIADLVQKSHEARTKAKQLLEKAKQKVEELIEKN